MANIEEILPHLGEDPQFDYYTIEITFTNVWEEVTRPKMLPKGSLFGLITRSLCPDLPDTFTVLDLSLAIKRVILENSWYDPGNPHMIIWPEPYQLAFNQAITDVSSLADYLLPHLVDDADTIVQQIEPLPDNLKFIIKIIGEKPEQEKSPWKIRPGPSKKRGKYMLAPGLRAALSSDPEFPTFCLAFSFGSILARTLGYISANCHRLINPRDSEIIDIRGDPLGAAFGVQAFTRTQLGYCIRRCLAKVYDEDAWIIPLLTHIKNTVDILVCSALRGAHY
jgi:hypothetical protein